MKNFEQLNPKDMDYTIKAMFDGEELEMKRTNTEIFKHLGNWAILNHIYHMGNENGFYIFEYEDMDRSKNQLYEYLEPILVEKQFPMHINLTEPHENDIEAFNTRYTDDIDALEEDEYPDWLN